MSSANSSYAANDSSAELVLEKLTEEAVARAIPVLCFMGLMMLIGTIGNILVITTYFRRVDKSSTNFFIFFLAVFDLLNCSIALPLEIYSLSKPYTNDQTALCRANKFIAFGADLSSGCIIICISFDRYLRFARPHNGFRVNRAKIATSLLCVLAWVISSLTIPVYGNKYITFEEHPSIVGVRCGVPDAKRNTVLPLLFNTLILLSFCVAVVILLSVYIFLGLKVKRWNQGRKSKMSRPNRMSDPCAPTAISEETETPDSPELKQSETFSFLQPTPEIPTETKGELTFMRPGFVRQISRSLDRSNFLNLDNSAHLNGTHTLPHRKSSTLKRKPCASVCRKASIPKLNEFKRRMKVSRTTVMFISATIAFVASHIPYACIKLAQTLNGDLTDHMTSVQYSLFLFAEYSFIVSYAVNPIIYSFLNPKYRRECKSLLRDLTNSLKCHSKKFFIG